MKMFFFPEYTFAQGMHILKTDVGCSRCIFVLGKMHEATSSKSVDCCFELCAAGELVPFDSDRSCTWYGHVTEESNPFASHSVSSISRRGNLRQMSQSAWTQEVLWTVLSVCDWFPLQLMTCHSLSSSSPSSSSFCAPTLGVDFPENRRTRSRNSLITELISGLFPPMREGMLGEAAAGW